MSPQTKNKNTLSHWLEKAQNSPHSRLGVILLTFLLTPLLLGNICNESTSISNIFSTAEDLPEIYGPKSVLPEATVSLWIWPGDFGGGDLVWTPPPGASNFQFPNRQPQPGGPPFVFKGATGTGSFGVSYTAPSETGTVVDTAQAIYNNGSRSSVSKNTEVTNQAQNAPAAVSRAETAPPLSPALLQANVPAWAISQWIDPVGVTLTTELCQDWFTALQGDEFFLAARMPMAATAITRSYRLPFVFGSPYSQTLYLDDLSDPWGSPMLLTATLEYRPERHTFLANKLPAAAGEQWAALGVSATEPAVCPQGLNLGDGDWGLKLNLLLDLHDQPNACEGCVVSVYQCYEGQKPPPGIVGQQTGALSLAQSLGLFSYQGEGITCLGPSPIHLTENAWVQLGGTQSAAITPTHSINLREYIWNPTGSVVTLTVAYTSTVAGWQLYNGDLTAPNLNDPITETTQIVIGDMQTHSVWLVNAAVPADTPAGLHALNITATSVTSPSLSTWDEISLWAGDWVAPSGPLHIYLPIVNR